MTECARTYTFGDIYIHAHIYLYMRVYISIYKLVVFIQQNNNFFSEYIQLNEAVYTYI